MWKACNRAKSKPVVVHDSEAYKSTGTTRYRRSLVVMVRCDTLQTHDMRCIVLAAVPTLRCYSVRELSNKLSNESGSSFVNNDNRNDII